MRLSAIGYCLPIGIIIISGCAYQPYPSAYDPVGFWGGIWHGLISPFSLIGGMFSDIRVYAFPNTGWTYDCGFMIGVLMIAGSSSQGMK